MIGNFPACWAFTKQAEGGLVDNPNDPGGLTNFGISQRAYPDIDIRDLTEQAAMAIYQRDYWARIAGDSLPAGVDLMVFDMAVNAGTGRSAMLLQGVLGLPEDGIIGPKTLSALVTYQAKWLIAGLHLARMKYYGSLPKDSTFKRGWGNRAYACMNTALLMLMATPPAVALDATS